MESNALGSPDQGRSVTSGPDRGVTRDAAGRVSADGHVVWNAGNDDSVVRAQRKPHDIPESDISGQDGKPVSGGVLEDVVVRSARRP